MSARAMPREALRAGLVGSAACGPPAPPPLQSADGRYLARWTDQPEKLSEMIASEPPGPRPMSRNDLEQGTLVGRMRLMF